MTVKIERLEWWRDVCKYGMVFEDEDECRAMGELHARECPYSQESGGSES